MLSSHLYLGLPCDLLVRGGADLARFIKAQRIKWLGHIQRMDQARPSGKLLDWKPMGTRPVGRPRQRWQEDVMEELKKLKVKNWKEAAKDRRNWRDLAEKAKNPQRVVVPNDDNFSSSGGVLYKQLVVFHHAC